MTTPEIVRWVTHGTFVLAAIGCTFWLAKVKQRQVAYYVVAGMAMTILFGIGRGVAFFALAPILLAWIRSRAGGRAATSTPAEAPPTSRARGSIRSEPWITTTHEAEGGEQMRRVTPVGALLLGVWIFGAICTDVYYFYTAKRDCIENKGWLTGWFWCPEADRSPYDTYGLLRGLLWPINLGSYLLRGLPHQTEHVSYDALDTPASESRSAEKLTRDQLAIIAGRCSELSEAYKKTRAGQLLYQGNDDLCIRSHSRGALAGRPSLLTMTTHEYSLYMQRRELTPDQRDSLLRDYEDYAKTCGLLTEKTMLVQPLVKKDLKPGATLDSREMAAGVIKWEPEIKNVTILHMMALSDHFQQAGLYGDNLAYFMDEFDRCLMVSEVFPGMMRDKDRLSADVAQIKNKQRAEIAKGFEATQPLRDLLLGTTDAAKK